MKTLNNAGRLDNQNKVDSAKQVRRQRTLTALSCESLEGRKLMTGFAGATGAMAGNMAEVSGGFGQSDAHRQDDFASHDFAGSRDGQDAMDQNGSPVGHDFADGRDGQGSMDQSSSSVGSDASIGSRMDLHSFRSMGNTDSGDGQGMGDGDFKADLMSLGGGGDQGGQSFAGGNQGGPSFRGGDQGGRSFGADDASFGGGMDRGNWGGDSSTGQMANMTGQTGSDTQLETDMEKLRTDSQAIHDKSQVTPALLATVRKDNEAIDAAKTGTADATALKTEQTDAQTIFSTNTAPTDAQKTQLQADHDAVLLSQGVSQTLIDQLATDVAAVKTASNFTAADQATLDADHAAITKDRSADSTTADSTTATPVAPTTTSSTTTSTSTLGTTTPAGSVATPAVAATSTPDSTTQAPATPDQTSTPAATPDLAAQTMAPPVAAAAATPTSVDPTMTQTTSTAAVTTPTTTDAGGEHMRHGRENFASSRGDVEHSFAGHSGGMGNEATHSFTTADHEGRGGRGMDRGEM